MLSVTDLITKYNISRRKKVLPDAISLNGESLEEQISSKDTLFNAFSEFHFLTHEFVMKYYFLNKTDFLNDDIILANKVILTGETVNTFIYNRKLAIKEEKRIYQSKCDDYDHFMLYLDKIQKIDYTIIHKTQKKVYSMMKLDNELINLNDIVDIFQNINPTKDIKLAVLCTSDKKLVFKVNPNFIIKFIDDIQKTEFEVNTISLFYEASKYEQKVSRRTILNFNTSTCTIEVYGEKKDDDTDFYVKNLLKDVLLLVQKKDLESIIDDDQDNSGISGEVEFNIPHTAILYIFMYKFFMTNPEAKRLFMINERRKPWCSTKDGFKLIYYHPLTYLLKDYLGNNLVYPFGVITISSNESKVAGNYHVTFKTKSLELMNHMINHFSKILSIYISFTSGININSLNYMSAFHGSVLFELKARAFGLFSSTYKSSGGAFTSDVDDEHRPICIKEEEVDSYEKMGRNVGSIELESEKHFFVCINEDNPIFGLIPAGVEIKSGNKFFPKCFSATGRRIKGTDVKVQSTTTATTGVVKSYGKDSVVESGVIREFFETNFDPLGIQIHTEIECLLIGSLAFLKTGLVDIESTTIVAPVIVSYKVTIDNFDSSILPFEELRKISIANSAICSLLITARFELDPVLILIECVRIRKLMIDLPYSLFSQELYDMSREKFIENMKDMNHFIDPYRYYRGLEEIFNKSIFVFSSERGRENPSSADEINLNYPTMEIPYCKNYHTRKFILERDVVCLFKNHNSERTFYPVPSCELIVISRKTSHDKIINFNQHTGVFKAVWDHFYKLTEVLFFEYTNNGIDTYFNIFNDWDPNTLGFGIVKGQEKDIYGKTVLLIYNDWNVLVPGIQPLIIINETSERASLKTKKECKSIFDVTIEESDGFWIAFQDNVKGLKILTKDDNEQINKKDKITFIKVKDIILSKNYVSALIQIINWLWRSDEGNFPFHIFFPLICVLQKQKIFDDIGKPKVCLNNMFLPTLNNYIERMKFLSSIWPFFFRHGKLNIYQELFDRIMNFMIIQDTYTVSMSSEDYHKKIPLFITGLIYTDEDFEQNGNITFSEYKHFESWVENTNPNIFNYISLNNMNIIYEKIHPLLAKYKRPYMYRDTFSDKIYLVQNVKRNDGLQEMTALKIALEWKASNRNLGYNTNLGNIPFRIEDVVYVEMGIDVDGKLRPKIDRTRGSTDYVTIFIYTTGEYACLLPLL